MSTNAEDAIDSEESDSLFSFANQIQLRFGKRDFLRPEKGFVYESHDEISSHSSYQDKKVASNVDVAFQCNGCSTRESVIATQREKVGTKLQRKRKQTKVQLNNFDMDLLLPKVGPDNVVFEGRSPLRKLTDTISKLQGETCHTSPVDSSICKIDSPGDVARKVSLKIKLRGSIQREEAFDDEPFLKIIERFSSKQGLPHQQLSLKIADVPIHDDSTIRTLGIGIADIIDCFIYEPDDDPGDVIHLKIQGAGKKARRDFAIRKGEKFSSILLEYSRLVGADMKDIIFSYDGEPVNGETRTSDIEDLVDGDIIDARIKV